MIDLDFIKELLAKADIEGLIEAGAPQDEYVSEAEEIYDLLSDLQDDQWTVPYIADLLLEYWEKAFEHDTRPEGVLEKVFLPLAEMLVKESQVAK